MDPSRVLIFAATMYLQTVGIFSASSIFLKEESINIEAKPNFIYFSMSLVNKINELEKYNKLIIKLQSFKATQLKRERRRPCYSLGTCACWGRFRARGLVQPKSRDEKV